MAKKASYYVVNRGPLLRRSGAARPSSATGTDVAARFNVAVGAAAIAAECGGAAWDLDRIFALLH